MYDQIIKLIDETTSTNEYGDVISKQTERIVFAELKSIGQSEFYQAHAVGLKPELKFVIADFLDYQNEKLLKFREFGSPREEIYSVIRTYRADNGLEIVCKRGVD
jgi:SPP1 family predicted phage head-tail adaptor